MSKPKKQVAVEAATNDLTVSDPYAVPVIFANSVVGSGHYAGNVNVTLAVARWTPATGPEIKPDLAICSRLRMDVVCAEQLYETLGNILQQLKPANATTQ